MKRRIVTLEEAAIRYERLINLWRNSGVTLEEALSKVEEVLRRDEPVDEEKLKEELAKYRMIWQVLSQRQGSN